MTEHPDETFDTSFVEIRLNGSRLPLKKKIGFGIADTGGNIFFTVMGFWALTYLTDTVYLAPALAGIAVMVAKIWDAITDPIVGYFSDNTRSRWGRRCPLRHISVCVFYQTSVYWSDNAFLVGAAGALFSQYCYDAGQYSLFSVDAGINC